MARSSLDRKTAGKPTEEQRQGPPPHEVLDPPSDDERRQARRLAHYTETSPALAGRDVDADWPRAQSVGEEAVGGTVATPDQSVVDDLGKALGVPQALGRRRDLALSGSGGGRREARPAPSSRR